MYSSIITFFLLEKLSAYCNFCSKSLTVSTLLTPLLPDESTGLIITGSLKKPISFFASSIEVYPLAFGVQKLLFSRNKRYLSLFVNSSTELYGLFSPSFSATYVVGAAGSDAYATIPSIFPFRQLLKQHPYLLYLHNKLVPISYQIVW